MYLQKSTFSKSSCDLRIASAVLLLFILNTTKTPRDLLRQNRYGIHDLLYLTSLTLEAVAPGEKTVNVIFRKHKKYTSITPPPLPWLFSEHWNFLQAVSCGPGEFFYLTSFHVLSAAPKHQTHLRVRHGKSFLVFFSSPVHLQNH